MTSNSHRGLGAALVLIALGAAGAASAEVLPLDFTVRDHQDVQAILVEGGVLFVDEGDTSFACTTLFSPAQWLVWTGGEGHALAVGDDGAWLTVQGGCHWRRTTGAVDGKRVVGVVQPDPGSARVVFAIDDPFGGTAVLETTDGGHTSVLSGSMAVSGVTLGGLAGHGQVAVIVGRADDGGLRAWWSTDGAETFDQVPDGGHVLSEGVSVAGFGSGHLWFWDAGSLHGLAEDGSLVSDAPTFSDGGAVAGDGEGAVWVAAGVDGLWRRGPNGDWEQHQTETTTMVHFRHERLWVARASAHEGDPMILRSADGGETWRTAWAVPDGWDFPVECVSSVSQICEESSEHLRQSLGLPISQDEEVPPTDVEPTPSEGCGAGVGRLPWGFLFCVLALLSVHRRRRAWGSP